MGKRNNLGGQSIKKNKEIRERKLTLLQKDFLIGSLLGDGSLLKGRNHLIPSFSIHHCEKQKDYLLWKREIMKSIISPNSKVRERLHPNGKRSFSFATVCNYELENFYNLFYYDKSKKYITEEILMKLTPFSLAIWYMDDGSTQKCNSARIITGSSIEEVNNIINILFKKFGLKFRNTLCESLKWKKRTRHLTLSVQDSKKLFEIIKQYVHPCMMYKIPLPVETKREAPITIG